MSETSKYFPPEVHNVISSSADRTYPNGKDVNNTHSSTIVVYLEKKIPPLLSSTAKKQLGCEYTAIKKRSLHAKLFLSRMF